ncbi:MAG: SDR family oxidoreductase [Acidimicrobiia bacterium]|nr:SDR family oxidoreductase [Acidimicrobiia bacterium]
MDLDGASALITGGSSGIGAAVARAVSRVGIDRLGLVARDLPRLEAVAAQCAPAAVSVWSMDLGDLAAVDALADEAWEALDGIDVLVNNAAMPKRRGVLELRDHEIEEVMRVNYHSPVRLARRLLPRMIARGHGLVINVSSLGGRLGILNETAYSASKFALTGWTEAAALDLWHQPVEVRLITPGAIDTAIWHRPDNDDAHFAMELASAESVADDIVACIAADGPFEVYTPDLSAVVQFKTSDIEAFQVGTIEALEAQP